MRMFDIIEKKRDGKELSKEEIKFFIEGVTKDDIPDYQTSALLMAIYFQDMTKEERVHLTKAMVESGEQVDLSAIEGTIVDKHSTGGVGDSVTIILAPLVASVGAPVAKMSGRGLGHTGGTLDKLEAIPNFNVEIPNEKFIDIVNKTGVAVVGQSAQLTPADQKLYSIRDVTATINSLPLMAGSIMSKKIAAGTDAIVLDVKTGSGAFMKKLEDSRKLAKAMVDIGNMMGRETMAVISDMNQPLGKAVGNSLEIIESIETLRGEGPKDLTELTLTIGSKMVYLANKASSLEEARNMLEESIESGAALEKLKTLIESQGGDASVIDAPEKLPKAKYQIELQAKEAGYIKAIDANRVGVASLLLGAGRMTKDSVIDLSVGVVLQKKIGDYVNEGDTLITIHSNDKDIAQVKNKLYSSFQMSDEKVSSPTLIYETITS
ncbi:MAG TPA: pyrimidine-nucleoside phosphorylase [Bacillota bacterium]|nr:pyrimidine-nucleoside phosphorylase [Bacillota bacterium]